MKISIVSQCRILVAVQYMNTQLFNSSHFFFQQQLATCDVVTDERLHCCLQQTSSLANSRCLCCLHPRNQALSKHSLSWSGETGGGRQNIGKEECLQLGPCHSPALLKALILSASAAKMLCTFDPPFFVLLVGFRSC